jgi:hypothetical protein
VFIIPRPPKSFFEKEWRGPRLGPTKRRSSHRRRMTMLTVYLVHKTCLLHFGLSLIMELTPH